MATTVHMSETTSATPQQVRAALTDYGPGTGQLFGNSTGKAIEGRNESARAG